MAEAVLDASALLAYVREEEGADLVTDALGDGCAISSVNVAEVLSKLGEHGVDPVEALAGLEELGDALEVLSPTSEDLVELARLRPATRDAGLSLGDRACLAVAARLQLPALTADRSWAELTDLPARVIVIR